jgi:hypothetical protein
MPAIDVDATTHYVEFEDVHGILKKTTYFIAGVCNRYSWPNLQKLPSLNCIGKRKVSNSLSANNTSYDNHDQVLGNVGYF